ncbi:MAG: phosphoribulokinase [Pseudomonadota bacterium]
MSARHPIIAVTGSSGAGTSTAKRVFERIFRQLDLNAAFVEGDSFHAYERAHWRQMIERARIRGETLSLFGPQGNLFPRLESLFREYGERGTGMTRRYLHTDAEANAVGQVSGSFTPWQRISAGTDVLFYEGLHGGLVTSEVNVAQHVDLLVGLTPTINLEWIQKIFRDTDERGYTAGEVTATILRRMPDYVNYILPQFSRADVNFQRVPLVDTSNPFEPREIPKPEESLVVIHFNRAARFQAQFEGILALVPDAFVSSSSTVVIPGEHQEQALELLMGDIIQQLGSRRRAALDSLE